MTAPAPRVLLVGVTRSGKSVLGAALAAKTGWPFVDADALVQRATGRTGEQLALEEGVAARHRAESDALTMLLGLPGPYVAELPIGVLLDALGQSRLAAAGARVVWLRASVPMLARRAGSALGPQPRLALAQAREETDPVLSELADVVVDVDLQTPAQLVRTVLRALGEPT